MKGLLLKSFLIVVFLSVFACRKKNEDESGPVCTPATDYTSIAIINEVAEFITTDPDDWTEDQQWCESIYSLFRTDTLNLDSTVADSTRLWAYPNPSDWYKNLTVYSSGKCIFQYAIVDESLHIKSKYGWSAHEGMNNFLIELLSDSSANFQTGHFYRLYYTAHARDNLFFYKGHGDILIQ